MSESSVIFNTSDVFGNASKGAGGQGKGKAPTATFTIATTKRGVMH